MSFKVVIPARWSSQRLPGKALADVAGKPLVVRCLERAREAGAEEVLVAVDDARIAAAVEAAGGEAVMTSEDCASGTDRLAEAAAQRGWADDVVVVNLQGDEPLVPPDLLARLAAALEGSPETGMATAATAITDREELFAESAVKVVLSDDDHALYFSRAPIPWARGAMHGDGMPPGRYLRHLGLYAYRVATLRALHAMEPAPIERAESLEQLRALSAGIRIHVTVLVASPPPGVDTPEDLERVRRIFGAAG